MLGLELPPFLTRWQQKEWLSIPCMGRQSWKSQKITITPLSEMCMDVLCLSELQASPEEENATPSKAKVQYNLFARQTCKYWKKSQPPTVVPPIQLQSNFLLPQVHHHQRVLCFWEGAQCHQ